MLDLFVKVVTPLNVTAVMLLLNICHLITGTTNQYLVGVVEDFTTFGIAYLVSYFLAELKSLLHTN